MGTERNEGRARIGINAHLLSARHGYRRAGIHHYIAGLLNQLSQAEGENQYMIFSRHLDVSSTKPDWQLKETTWPTERRIVRILWEQLAWPLAASRLKLDLIHSMAFVVPVFSPCPAVVTVYDLSFYYYPERFLPLQRRYLNSQTRRSCRQARRVVTISGSGRQDVHRLYGVPLERIDIVRPGVDDIFFPRPPAEVEQFRRGLALPEQFVLHVGTLQPRKNIPVLLEAFARLTRPGLKLVLVGGEGWGYKEIFEKVDSLGLNDQVHFSGYVPDASLPLWYNAASMLVFPSLYEGFGLPVAQAMACGTPVIAAASSSIPEVAGQAARLFAPDDVPALADHMVNVLDDEQSAATMRKNGLEHVKNFSWQAAGKEMAAVYRKALDKG